MSRQIENIETKTKTGKNKLRNIVRERKTIMWTSQSFLQGAAFPLPKECVGFVLTVSQSCLSFRVNTERNPSLRPAWPLSEGPGPGLETTSQAPSCVCWKVQTPSLSSKKMLMTFPGLSRTQWGRNSRRNVITYKWRLWFFSSDGLCTTAGLSCHWFSWSRL